MDKHQEMASVKEHTLVLAEAEEEVMEYMEEEESAVPTEMHEPLSLLEVEEEDLVQMEPMALVEVLSI